MTIENKKFFMRPLDETEPTRLRNDHNTAGVVIGLYKPEDLMECDQEFIADVNLYLTGQTGPYQVVGDKWGRVIKINNISIEENSWMAINHKGTPICKIVNIDPPPVTVWEVDWILENPRTGERMRYIKDENYIP